MIKINLIVGKQPFKMPVIMGMDFSYINFKAFVIVWLLSFVPGYTIYQSWESEKEAETKALTQLEGTVRDLTSKAKRLKALEQEADEFKKQEKMLQEKLMVVRQLLKSKISPVKLLLYIAENIPENVWLTSLDLKDRQLKITGQATSFDDITVFMSGLKNAIFFVQPVQPGGMKTIIDDQTGKRREEFTVLATIKTFD